MVRRVNIKNIIGKLKLFVEHISKKWNESLVKRYLKRIKKKLKNGYRQLKYLDKTKANYFVVMSFLGLFCTFTMVTYSAFTFSKTLNAAVITIGKLRYTLSSSSSGYSNGVVTLTSAEPVEIELTLSSLNSFQTKYALMYNTEATNVDVYFSQEVGNNMNGSIGASGSQITMKIILVNNSGATATVNLNVIGGYTHNNLEASNITVGYYEADIISRLHTLDTGLGNDTRVSTIPTAASGYTYFRSVCNNPATPVWDNTNRTLGINNVSTQVVCDNYFKLMEDDLEVYYVLQPSGATLIDDGEVTTSAPSASYTFREATCTTGTPTWSSNQLTVSGFDAGTICVAYFNANS